MARLTSRDFQGLLQFLRDTYALRNLDGFVTHLVTSIRRVVLCDTIGYSDMDLRQRTSGGLDDPPEAMTPEAQQAFGRHMHEHPVINHFRRTGDPRAYKLSDFLTKRQVHRLTLYNEYARPFLGGIDHQIAFNFVASPIHVTGVGLGRRLKDFSERERLFLNLLRPHLFQAYRNAEAVNRMGRELDWLRRGVDAFDRGIILLGEDGQPRLMTTCARRWLAEYFGRVRRAERLPEAIQRWVQAQEAALTRESDAPLSRAPLVVKRDGRRLVVRLLSEPGGSLLLLEEQRTAVEPAALERFGLSRREAEVLAWVAQGKISAEIATILGARTRTVEKHLERIYRKLGVETRTAAAAAVYTLR